MKKLLLIILLAVFSSGAMADWQYFDTSIEGGISFYVEPTSIRKQDNKVIFWYLSDHFSPQTNRAEAYLSAKSKVAFDCKKETMKYLAVFYHKKSKGEGQSNDFINGESSEFAIPPNTILEKLMKYGCSKN